MVTSSGVCSDGGMSNFNRYYFTIPWDICVSPGDLIYTNSDKFYVRVAIVDTVNTASFQSPTVTLLQYKDFANLANNPFLVKNKGYLRICLRLKISSSNIQDTFFTLQEVKEELVILRKRKTEWRTYYNSNIDAEYSKYISYNNNTVYRIYKASKYYKMSGLIEVSEENTYKVIMPIKTDLSKLDVKLKDLFHVTFFDEDKNIIGGKSTRIYKAQAPDIVLGRAFGSNYVSEFRPVHGTKYMIIQWSRVNSNTVQESIVYDFTAYDDIKVLGTGIPKEYKEDDFPCTANFHNSKDGIDQFLEVANSYYDRKVTVNGEEEYCLSYTTVLRDRIQQEGGDYGRVLNITSKLNRYTGGIDCSAFVGMVLRGIKFDNTYYYGYPAGHYLGDAQDDITVVVPVDADLSDEFETEEITVEQFLSRNPFYEWSINTHEYKVPIDYFINKNLDLYSEVSGAGQERVATAAGICFFFESQGNKVFLDKKLTNIDKGDLIFFSRYTTSGGLTANDKVWVQPGRYKHVSHVGIIYDKVKVELDSNGNPLYDSAGKLIIDSQTSKSIITGKTFENTGEYWPVEDYPYIYVIIEVTGVEGACYKRILRKTGSLSDNNIDTITSICRPFLNTSSNIKFETPDDSNNYPVGSISIDNDYLYVKTRDGMKKVLLSSI